MTAAPVASHGLTIAHHVARHVSMIVHRAESHGLTIAHRVASHVSMIVHRAENHGLMIVRHVAKRASMIAHPDVSHGSTIVHRVEPSVSTVETIALIAPNVVATPGRPSVPALHDRTNVLPDRLRIDGQR